MLSQPWAFTDRKNPRSEKTLTVATAGDSPLGRALLQLLHEGTGLLGRLGFNQQVKVLWHQNPADQQETRLWSKFAQELHKIPAEAVTGKERVPAIGTGGQKLQLAGLEVAWIKGHPYEISTRRLQEINRIAALCASLPNLYPSLIYRRRPSELIPPPHGRQDFLASDFRGRRCQLWCVFSGPPR
jgi:hypothetical protein